MRALLVGCFLFGFGCDPGGIEDSMVVEQNPGDGRPSRDSAVSQDTGQTDASSTRDAPSGVADGQVLDPCRFRSLGYGKESADSGASVGTRKSAVMCLLDHSTYLVRLKGQDAGSCEGDSGGPLFVDGTLRVVGVLHGSDTGCRTDEAFSFFVSAVGHRTFIEQTLAAEPE